jgi:hypothetical protein
VKWGGLVLLSILLCGCAEHGNGGTGERSLPAESGRLRLMDRSDPLVEHTFQIMEVRAHYSDLRERLRSAGRRVCEEGENGTAWKQDCNKCQCEWGVRSCTKAGCPSTASRDDDDDDTYNIGGMPAVDYRELYPSISRRLCDHEASWKESCNTCWCEGGYVVCSKVDCPVWP